MTLVLRETDWAKQMIERQTLGSSPYETLRRIARYYIDLGKTKTETKKSIEKYVESCMKNSSILKWSKTIDAAVSYAAKHPAVNVECINITADELKTIEFITLGRQAQRLAFTLLCLSKYWNICTGTNEFWVNSADSEIMQMANIKTSIKRQCKLYHDLREAGLISFSHRVDCNNIRVNFANDDSDTAMEITDLRNLGNQYLMQIGEPYFSCAECGVVSKLVNPQAGRKQKYCYECAAKVAAAQKLEYTHKSRQVS